MLLKVPKNRYEAASRVGGVAELLSIQLKETNSYAACKLDSINSESLIFDMKSSYKFTEESNTISVIVKLGLKSEDANSGDECKTGFAITAAFELLYKLKIEPPPSEVRDFFFDSFANVGAVYNVWPYWRELHGSLAQRFGLPHLQTPLIQFRPEKEADKEAKSATKKTSNKKPKKSSIATASKLKSK